MRVDRRERRLLRRQRQRLVNEPFARGAVREVALAPPGLAFGEVEHCFRARDDTVGRRDREKFLIAIWGGIKLVCWRLGGNRRLTFGSLPS